MTRSKVVAGGALIFAFSLAGGGVAAADPLSKSEWRTQAGTICSDSNEDVSAIANDVVGDLGQDEQPSDAQLAEFAERVIPVIDTAIDDVVDLEEPAAFKKNVKKWANAARDTLEKAEDDPSVFNTPDPFKKAGKFARKLGLKGCGSG